MELTDEQKKDLEKVLRLSNLQELIVWIQDVATEHGNERYDEGCNDSNIE